jgi:hypothetical protein
MNAAARRETRITYGDARCGKWRASASRARSPPDEGSLASEPQEAQNGDAERTRERATNRRPEPDCTHAGTTPAQELLGMAGGGETRAGRDMDEEETIGEREKRERPHALNSESRVGVQDAFWLRFACPRLHLDNPHDMRSLQPRQSHMY